MTNDQDWHDRELDRLWIKNQRRENLRELLGRVVLFSAGVVVGLVLLHFLGFSRDGTPLR